MIAKAIGQRARETIKVGTPFSALVRMKAWQSPTE